MSSRPVRAGRRVFQLLIAALLKSGLGYRVIVTALAEARLHRHPIQMGCIGPQILVVIQRSMVASRTSLAGPLGSPSAGKWAKR